MDYVCLSFGEKMDFRSKYLGNLDESSLTDSGRGSDQSTTGTLREENQAQLLEALGLDGRGSNQSNNSSRTGSTARSLTPVCTFTFTVVLVE